MIVFKSQFKREENTVKGEPLKDEPHTTHNDVPNTGISVSFSKSQGVCHMHLLPKCMCLFAPFKHLVESMILRKYVLKVWNTTEQTHKGKDPLSQ